MQSKSLLGVVTRTKYRGLLSLLFILLMPSELAAQSLTDNSIASNIKNLSKSSVWNLVSQTRLTFDTFHPQGMVKIGEYFFVSSVETKERPERIEALNAPHDRTAGIGVGHLFKIDSNGQLAGSITLGESSMYHPGGIDFDGISLWVSVAEYRPNSRSIIYKVDPDSLASTEVLRFEDHLGAIVRDSEKDRLHAVSWGSRRLYSWQGADGDYSHSDALMTSNPSHYIDYQDCQSLAFSKMLCSGLSSYQNETGASLKLGGVDLIDLMSMQPEFQLPMTQFTDNGALLNQNPFYVEADEKGELQFYFVPEDNQSVLYQYSIP